MKQRYWIFCLKALVCAMALGGGISIAAQTRLERPPARDIEGTPVLPAGAQTIPAGTIIILEMETPLDSKNARVSDRFRARVATPVIDANGRTLIPAESIVEGRVSAAKPARWARRSGTISVTFDNLRLSNGRVYPIRGYLTGANASDRKRIDDEGNLKAGGSGKRDVFFVGGGAGAGAAIGAITGGALAGAGVGAAVGLTATLLMKGKDAVIPPGQRFGVELSQPLNFKSTGLISGIGGGNKRPIYNNESAGGMIRVAQGNVDVSDIRAERTSDGLLRIMVTAETPTPGWRIYTNHEQSGDVIDVRLRGVPPAASDYPQRSYPSAPPIVIPDRNGRFRRVNVLAKNGTRAVSVNGGYIDTGEVTRPTPIPDYPNEPPYRPTPTPTPRPSSGGSDARTLANQVENFRYDYAASLGVFINPDGSYDFVGNRRPSNEERLMLDNLGSLLTSLRAMANSPNAASRRSNAIKVQEDAQQAENSWRRAPMSNDLNQRARTLIQQARGVADDALR